MESEYSAPRFSNRFDTVILVRTAPDELAGESVPEEITSRHGTAPLSVFLHGNGVAWARPEYAPAWQELAGEGGPVLQVCQAAWRRRFGDQQPVLFALSSLIQFWHQAAKARQLVSLRGSCSAVENCGFVMEIETAPDGFSQRELLEMALAAASLELDLIVVFAGPGLDQILGQSAVGWRQLVDHELAPIYWLGDKALARELMPGAVWLDPAARDKRYADRRVLKLRV